MLAPPSLLFLVLLIIALSEKNLFRPMIVNIIDVMENDVMPVYKPHAWPIKKDKPLSIALDAVAPYSIHRAMKIILLTLLRVEMRSTITVFVKSKNDVQAVTKSMMVNITFVNINADMVVALHVADTLNSKLTNVTFNHL